MNLLAAAWKLSTYQVWNRKRRLSSLFLLALPVLIVVVVSLLPRQNPPEFYKDFVTIALGYFLVPFVAIFWGSAVLTDEIEGKTLVYLWTRPRHKGIILLLKLMGTWVWLALLAFIGVGAAFIYAYSSDQTGGLANNLPILLWDWRALALGALAYSSIGFLLSVLFKKPLTYGLIIIYAWEIVPSLGPGFAKRISIRQQVAALVTHKEESKSLVKTITDNVVITETEALLTLLGIAAVCIAATVMLVTQREFLSDDPARNQ